MPTVLLAVAVFVLMILAQVLVLLLAKAKLVASGDQLAVLVPGRSEQH